MNFSKSRLDVQWMNNSALQINLQQNINEINMKYVEWKVSESPQIQGECWFILKNKWILTFLFDSAFIELTEMLKQGKRKLWMHKRLQTT